MVYFGDSQDGLMPAFYLNLPDIPLLEIPPFDTLKQKVGAHEALFLHQTHSDQGLMVNEANKAIIRPFKPEGDFLITVLPQVAMGVMTADCLPIIYYDAKNKIAAAAHAGWRGSVLGIAVKTVERMQELYGTHLEDIQLFFGPSAHVCCYEVQPDFERHLAGYSEGKKFLIKRDNKVYFDVPGFNRMLFEALGIKPGQISEIYAQCTMCKGGFCSARLGGPESCRQMTVICLK